ncbi:YceI family protein [Geobacter sp. SVR]|uniref:YceI family protein n=1 Tax=Geobacter sp. SVR TaxID=2495594 RepID=UPI00143F0054|nr:YceI family protein [Geobacter sp. SVR]BCS52571.1 polyisoprenoid-binding protein [Geobacter sp. SVR]GCF83991.1 polyisoprenoid-binding protein [Geobacter sp. SVR]
MKRILVSVSTIVALFLPVLASADTWKIDPDHSNVGFKVRHLMVSNVKGSFEKHAGTVVIDDRDIAKSRVEVTIDTASINTNVRKRDDHLRSPDFLDVAKYPSMTFVSRKVVRVGGDRLQVTGDLTLHGITREVVLDVEGLTGESRDPMGNIRRGASASTRINRKDYGLTWNKALETGGVAVGEEIAISLEIELIKAK